MTKATNSEEIINSLPHEELLFLNSLECPYAQRTWIALLEKGLKFSQVEISLRNAEGQYAPELKPEWFLRLNPNGKVPVLAYRKEGGGINRVYESNICNEFLEDYQAEPPLMPHHPAIRGWARIIIQQFSERFVPSFYKLLLRQDPEGQREACEALHEQLRLLEGSFEFGSDGPFFLGKQFSLVDVSLIPFFLRFPVLQHYRRFSLPEECSRLAAWWQHAKSRPSVQTASESGRKGMNYDDYLMWVYERYADASAKSTSAADFRDKH